MPGSPTELNPTPDLFLFIFFYWLYFFNPLLFDEYWLLLTFITFQFVLLHANCFLSILIFSSSSMLIMSLLLLFWNDLSSAFLNSFSYLMT